MTTLRLLAAVLLAGGGAAGQDAVKPCCPPDGAAAIWPTPTDRKSVALRMIIDRLQRGTAPFIGEATLEELEKRLATIPKDAPAQELFALRLGLGDVHLNFGRTEEAIDDYQACRVLAATAKDTKSGLLVLKRQALTWLRLGERRNCITNHNRDSCILPLREGAIHQDRKGSEEAARCPTAVLNADGGDLASMWLLNVAHMTLGSWPDGVPPQWRIAPSAFASERELPRMYDIAPRLGLNATNHAGGSAMDDFDGDGRLDIAISGSGLHEPMRLFLQQADGTFRDVTLAAGLSGQICALNFIHFDADNDGRFDLLIQRGAWQHDFGQIPNSLLIQQPDGTFVDRTLEAGIEIAAPSQVAAVADIDNDGDLDLFLGYEHGRGAEAYPCRLFRNRGNATFEEITKSAGVANDRYCKGAAFGDYDGDGLPDLYVSNLNGVNRLYHNDGDGRFHDVALELGVGDPYDSFSCFFFDYDNDGWLDLYVSCYDTSRRATDVAAYYRNGSTGGDTQRLYENDRHGGFRDVTRRCHMDRVCFPMGSNFGDVDNDGWPDLYFATGEPDFGSLWPNVLLHNGGGRDGGRRFEDVTTSTGTGHLQKGHGVSFGDLDGDGDQDLFVELGGALPDDAFHDVLFENPGHGNHWLTVQLVGTKSNRFGVGARIRATIEEATIEAATNGDAVRRDVFAFVGATSSFGGNSLQEEMGLGRATRLVALEVHWPCSGTTQTFDDVPRDSTIVVEEGGTWRKAVTPGRLAGSASGATGSRDR